MITTAIKENKISGNVRLNLQYREKKKKKNKLHLVELTFNFFSVLV